LEQIVLVPEPKLLDVGAGAGAKHFRWPEMEPDTEPEIWIPAQQSWFTSILCTCPASSASI